MGRFQQRFDVPGKPYLESIGRAGLGQLLEQVILPILGKKLKFTTAGIPIMVDAFACSTASRVRTVASYMLRSNLAL
jgi:hypothetical protein